MANCKDVIMFCLILTNLAGESETSSRNQKNKWHSIFFLSLGFVTPFPSSYPDSYNANGRKVIVKVPISFALNPGESSSNRLAQVPPMSRPRSLNRYERKWCSDIIVPWIRKYSRLCIYIYRLLMKKSVDGQVRILKTVPVFYESKRYAPASGRIRLLWFHNDIWNKRFIT